MTYIEDYEDDLEGNDEEDGLNMNNLLSGASLGSRPQEATPIGGTKYGDDKPHSGSYGSLDTADSSQLEGKTTVYSELEFEQNADDSEMQQQLFVATEKLVNEGEKNVSLALELEKCKDGMSALEKETTAFRELLLRGINGGVADSSNYTHVGLDELLRLRIQESVSAQRPNYDDTPFQLQREELARNQSSVGVIQALECKLGIETHRNETLEAKILALKGELEEQSKHMEGVENLRLKVSQMVKRLRTERELKSKYQKDLSIEKNKVDALSDHIEKLMVHLKHEAIAKARSLSDQSRLQREMEMMRTRNLATTKKNERKDQVIAEMRESGKLLEDQLRLMDEKYMELRSKLDWTRSQTERIVKRREDELKQLQMKFSMMSEQQILLENGQGDADAVKKSKTKSKPVLEGRSSVIELNRKLAASRFQREIRASKTKGKPVLERSQV